MRITWSIAESVMCSVLPVTLSDVLQYDQIAVVMDVNFKIFFSFTAYKFQENLLKTMLQIENTFFALGESCTRNCLIICDRGAMDASACMYLFSLGGCLFSNAISIWIALS
jgi:hypothetical protein